MKTKTRILAILAALGLFGGVALAQPIPVPQVQSVGPNDLFQDVVGGVPQPGNAYASGALLTASFGGYGDNFLIGGDPGVNLWQRGTPSGTLSDTAAPVYPADRWFAWSSLTGTTFTVAQVTTAAALPTGVQDAMQVKMSNSQTGTGQVCVGQVIASASAYKLAGHTVEFDFNTYAGATFNLSASAINAYIVYGTTSADQGSVDMAYGLNGGGSGSVGWTGQANATSGTLSGIVNATMYRGMAVGFVPATATQVGVALCFTASGTSSGTGGTDLIDYSNMELRIADSLTNWANATTAYNVNTTTNQVQATINGAVQNIVVPAFSRRQPAVEAALQLSYYYQVNELGTANWAQGIYGQYEAATTCFASVQFPVPMRIAPSIVETAITSSTFAVQSSGTTNEAPAALAGSTTSGLALQNSTIYNAQLSFITASKVQYNSCSVVSAAGSGWFAFSAEE